MTPDLQAPPVTPERGPGQHRYNDDLLIEEKPRERARREFPELFHVLDDEKLRLKFNDKDTEANAAKRVSQAWGVCAVVLALLSLLGGSSEVIWANARPPWPAIIAIVSSLFGLSAILIAAFGILHGKRKDLWLTDRLMTERFRQFHFQSFVFDLQEIVQSLDGEDAAAAYTAKRDERFQELLDNLENKGLGDTAKVIAPEKRPQIWVHNSGWDEPQWPAGQLPADRLGIAFKAYDTFRFSEQIGYAEYMLRERNLPGKDSPSKKSRLPWYPGMYQPMKVKRRALQFVWQLSLTSLVLFELFILVAHICGSHFANSSWAHVGVVWSALVAIATKTLSDGLALTREIERYEEYLAVMSELARAFKEPGTDQHKWRLMVETEKASFEEMREFIRSNQEAIFIM